MTLMKRTLPLVSALVLAVGVSGCDGCLPTPQLPPPQASTAQLQAALASIVATCAHVRGSAEVRRSGSTFWEPLTTGLTLRPGDWVRTGPDAEARIEFLAGGGVELGADAVVIVDHAPPEQGVSDALLMPLVQVQAGEVSGFSTPAAAGKPPARVALRLDDGSTVRLQGDRESGKLGFRVSRGAGGRAELAVSSGEAKVDRPSGKQVVLTAGQGTILSGEGEGAVFSVIDFPDLLEPEVDARFRFRPGATIKLRWAEMPGATGYRLQVARDFAFRQPVGTWAVEETTFELPADAAGVYAWRVASRDAEARYGEYGFARRIHLDEAPQLDLLTAPTPGEVVPIAGKTGTVRLSWEAFAGAEGYQVVVARGKDLQKDVIARREEVTGTTVEIEKLPPGDYLWGVYTDEDHPVPLFSKARPFTVRRAAAVKMEAPTAINQWGQ
jgi:hypothetical protein